MQAPPGQLIEDDAYYTFSSVFFYTNRTALLLNGRKTNLEYGSYAPDAPQVFIDDAQFRAIMARAGALLSAGGSARGTRISPRSPGSRHSMSYRKAGASFCSPIMRVLIDATSVLLRSAGIKSYTYHWIEHLRGSAARMTRFWRFRFWIHWAA